MATIVEPVAVAPDEDAALTRTWDRPPGLRGWLAQVNHKAIGLRFIVTAFVFLLLGGVEALMMRTQLARPENTVLSPELYNQIMTMHGTTMMFFFAVPVVEGLGIYLVPLMIGARDMAFPRMNALGYWIYLLAGVTLYAGLFVGQAPDAGWTSYVPLSLQRYSPGIGMDLWTTAITFLEISALLAGVELAVTILKQRAPGMTISRVPIFVWAMLVTSLMIIFAMPAVMLASVMLGLDRFAGTHFFNIAQGGDPVLWQHLFWFFGHPEVYIVFVPGLGIISTIVAAFARRELVAFGLVAVSTILIGFVSFGLWVHHMFTTGLPLVGTGLFAAASMVIAIPSGIQIFAWLATLFSSKRVEVRTPLLFVAGFVVIFVLGGITGIMTAMAPLDWQIHDTYFVVAHFHYVLIGGTVFPALAALHYWLPKVSGRVVDERLGRWSFWLLFAGMHVAFFPMHITGLAGMPRRVYTYVPGLGWETLNLISTVGAFLFAGGVLAVLANFARTLRAPKAAHAEDPWRAHTLEWATTSPPPAYNFARIPAIRARDPLWSQPELRRDGTTDAEASEPVQDTPGEVEVPMRNDRRETPLTTVIDAIPEGRLIVAGPSLLPMLLAATVGLTFIGALWSLWLVPVGAFLSFLTLAAWHWPEPEAP